MKFALIIILVGAMNGGKAIQVVHFETLELCQVAVQAIGMGFCIQVANDPFKKQE